jgi:hypothetical protein
MWSDKEIEAAARVAKAEAYTRCGAARIEFPDVWEEIACAALNAVPRWRPIESAPEQKYVLGAAEIDGD